MKRLWLAAFAVVALTCCVVAQDADPQLAAYIDSIHAIDNHAHVVAPDTDRDKDYDALRCESLPPATAMTPANMRTGPDFYAAWKALYAVSVSSDSPDDMRKVVAAQAATRKQHGDGYYNWVLQQAGFDVVLANRIAMSPLLDTAHFRWVPYDDALLFPLDNSGPKTATPDRKALFNMEEQVMRRYLREASVNGVPETLDGYLKQIVTPTLERQQQAGAVAIKFEAAYLRSLDFEPATQEAAAAVYNRFARGGQAALADYKTLQDFLFRYIAAEAGRLGLAVHIHTGFGCGEFFDDRGSDPILLDSVLNDSNLRKTNFVLLHGGSPFERHNVSLILKPNVYVDTSVLELLFSPAELARIVRPWLEVMPEHVIFGTDASPNSPANGWEENTWIGSRNARRAFAIALTQMVRDGVITLARAKEIADDVFRGNAAKLYRLK